MNATKILIDGEVSQKLDYDLQRCLDSSDIGKRLSHVVELLRFTEAGLGATGQGNRGAQLVIQEVIREIRTVVDSNVKVMEVIMPF